MKFTRRQIVQGLGAAGVAAALPSLPRPAIAQNEPIKIGILAPFAGVAGTAGEVGRRGAEWAAKRINQEGGIAGRQIKLIVEEEGSSQETVERFRRLLLKEEVDCVQGLISTGTSLSVAPVAEQERKLLIMWDGTTQDGVQETMPNPRYVFRSTNNECEAVMGSLLAVKHFKGQFKTIAGINPDYSYGRNNWAAFQAILERYDIDAEVVAEQWVPVGTMDLTSHVAALNAVKPDLIFSSLLFADLPIFMKQGYAVGLFRDTKVVLPAAAWQIDQLHKDFMPEGVLFGHNTLYFAHPDASDLQKAFVEDYMDQYGGAPHWEAERAYFALAAYKTGVEAAYEAAGRWPEQEEIIDAIPGREVESLGGPGRFREDKIAEQIFYQGLSTNDNAYNFPTLATITSFRAEEIQAPAGGDFWEWIKTAKLPV